MKHLLSITLLILLLSACAPSVSEPAPLPAVDLPAGAPLAGTATTEVKVVEMATQTPVEATLAPTNAAPTAAPSLPTPTSAAAALPKTLEELGIPAATYEDKVAGLAMDYPSSWILNDLPEDIRSTSTSGYTASFRSPRPATGPKQQEGIPPDMAAIDLTVIMDGPKTLEDAVAERRASASSNEMGLPIQIVLEEEWVLRDGTKARRLLYNLGKDPLGGYGDRDKMSTALVAIINGNMVLVNGMGDLSLFDVVAASLRQIPQSQ